MKYTFFVDLDATDETRALADDADDEATPLVVQLDAQEEVTRGKANEILHVIERCAIKSAIPMHMNNKYAELEDVP